jgi:hypothetical protein
MNTRSLTGNRDRDKGWAQTPEGNWVPSLFDRRRVAVAEMNLVAEVNHLPGVPGPLALQVLVEHHSTGEEDAKALIQNFGKWMHSA